MSENASASFRFGRKRRSSVDLRELKFKAYIEIFNDLKVDGYVFWVGRGKDGHCHIYAGLPRQELPIDWTPEDAKFKRVVDVGVCDPEAYASMIESGQSWFVFGECIDHSIPEDSVEDDILYAPFSFVPTRKLRKYYYSKGFKLRVRTKRGIKFLYAFKRAADGSVIKRCLGLKSQKRPLAENCSPVARIA